MRFSWNIKEDPEEFLQKIRVGRGLLQISDEELFNGLPFFLEGVALNWYRNSCWHWFDFVQFQEF